MPHPKVEAVAARATEQLPATIAQLCEYLTIPAISCQEENFVDVRTLGKRIRDDMTAIGMTNARLLELDDALPCVAAEWMGAGNDAPVVLIYGHMDLQPVGEPNWKTDPHVGVEKDGRLFARGSADDMGGWVSHMASLSAWLKVADGPPCNVRVLIEGEEEIGSPNLERFMDAFPEAFESDVMVLTDCENPSPEVPGLTVSLRGLMEMKVTCKALSADVHSGLWGNMVPDVSTALMTLVARLVDENGRLKLGLVEVDAARKESGALVPLSSQIIREGAHIVSGVEPLPEGDRSAAEWMWWQPALTVVSTTLPVPGKEKNALRESAAATLSVRVAPDQQPEALYVILERELLRNSPGGVQVSVECISSHGTGWLYTPKGPAFAAADRAYERSWGHKLVQVGVGGSIPFVALFGRRFGDLPLILNGVMDPLTTAHGPNESMHLGIFAKAVLANVYLLDELGALGKKGLKA